MHDHYACITAAVEKPALGELREHLATGAAAAVSERGAVLVSATLGAGSIGWHDDEVVAVVGWPAGTSADVESAVTAALGDARGGATAAVERLQATARPTEPSPIERRGVIAHRWFELAASGDFDELLDLSTEAWPAFERTYDAVVEGFLRSTDDPRRVLLLTRYASFAEWERSREVRQATGGDLAEARRRFVRRQQLTRRQIVRVAPLA